MDALGSILSWDENDETAADNDSSTDLTSSNRSQVNDVQNQNVPNYMYDDGFLAQLKAEIAAHNTNNSTLSANGVLQMQLQNPKIQLQPPPPPQQQTTTNNAETTKQLTNIIKQPTHND